ncbi:MAG: DNA protecting protein DprA [Bacteroidetes bacterium GWF2_33_16]|nr:MAG: DNA protecting protein DprA [Bacteroidetes bacterium GWE2_32_14]OFY03904.1 MAG: DNA protecting protein DprA [Bacteroidetes bacterium GWF2_33_16]
MNTELKYKIALSLIPKIGHVTAKKLIAYVGSIEGIFFESKKNLLKIPGIGEILAQSIIGSNVLPRAEEEIEFIKNKNIHVFFYLDKEYPERLRHCDDAPILIYTLGNTSLNWPKMVSIVGTRKATSEGVAFCNKLIKDLAERGHDPVIVSGLAYGIDAAAHNAALENNLKTFAVLGHGFDIIYPASHKPLAKKIIEKGLLITDFTSKTMRDRNNFIKRNRIIAGLSDATIVIESGEGGGSLITADLANSYNRDVFAVPGRVSDQFSRGCNQLIKTNKAAMLENIEDLEYFMGWEVKNSKAEAVQRDLFFELSDDEKNIAAILRTENELTIDVICLKASMPTSKVSPILLNLEFAGIVKAIPGKKYKLISPVYL